MSADFKIDHADIASSEIVPCSARPLALWWYTQHRSRRIASSPPHTRVARLNRIAITFRIEGGPMVLYCHS
jgi:hypothetical protein